MDNTRKPLLSLIIGARNDSYMGDFAWRLSACLNYLGRSLSSIEDTGSVEVIICDWGSEKPVHEVLKLRDDARRIVKFVIVPPEIAIPAQKDSPFPIPIVQNIAIRRSRGEFIAQTDSDIIFTPLALERLLQTLTGSLDIGIDPAKSLLVASRRHIPHELTFAKPGIEEIERYLRQYGAMLPVDKLFPGIATPSGMAVMHRDLWHEFQGYDERLIYWGWMEIDLYLRVMQQYPWRDLANSGSILYHIEHYSGENRPREPRKMNPMLNPQTTKVNDENWGMAEIDFTEVTLPESEIDSVDSNAAGDQLPSIRHRLTKAAKLNRKEMLEQVSSPETQKMVIDALTKIHNTKIGQNLGLTTEITLRERILAEKIDAEWDYKNLLAWFSKNFHPLTYLELGIGSGSGAPLVAHCFKPASIYGFDAWHNGEKAPLLPAPTWLAEMLDEIGHAGYIRHLKGVGQADIEDFFMLDDTPPKFDLVFHNLPLQRNAVLENLRLLAGRIAPGGALVFVHADQQIFTEVLAELQPEVDKFISVSGYNSALFLNSSSEQQGGRIKDQPPAVLTEEAKLGLGAGESELDFIIPPEVKDDELYDLIKKIACDEKLETVLEIGSSSGEGSTQAFVEGLNCYPHKPVLFCLELSLPRFKALKKRFADFPFVKCYNDSTVPLSSFPSEQEVADFYNSTKSGLNHYPLSRVLGWLKQDIDYVRNSDVPGKGIERIKRENCVTNFDMVLIDGSEFTGKAELDAVYGARIILLDDVNSFKNRENYDRLSADPQYELVRENWNLRAGYAVFKRSTKALPVHFFTIVLNGEPFIRYHLDIFRQLPFEWHWHIVEGLAELKYDTGWSLQFGGRVTNELHRNGLSNDSTTEYIDQLAGEFPENITVYRKQNGSLFDGKVEMVNAPLANIREDCLLWQVDVDELWTVEQIKKMCSLFTQHSDKTAAYFYCRFLVGPRKHVISVDTWGNRPEDWPRVWRFRPGMKWTSHEPQVLVNSMGQDVKSLNPFTRDETLTHNLIFQHFAYVIEAQLRFKEIYYGYRDAVARWEQLQNVTGKVELQTYLPWATNAIADDWSDDLGTLLADRLLKKTHKSKKLRIAGEDYEGTNDLTMIDRESIFADKIYDLFTKLRPKKLIETGTYMGTGTTPIIASSLQKLRIDDAEFYTIEVNPDYYQQALENLARDKHSNVLVLNGISVPRNLLPSPEEIEDMTVNNVEFDDIYVDHQEHERTKLYFDETNFSNVPDDLIGRCLKKFDYCPDFVLLDSGGHMGNIEFNYLIERLKGECYIALDDIYHIKHHKSFLQVKEDPRFELIYYSKEKFGFCIAKFTPQRDGRGDEVKSVLWVRLDSIGDAILSMPMLEHIRNKYESAVVAVLCQKRVAEIYRDCPWVDDVFEMDYHRAIEEENYRSYILRRLQKYAPDLVLNSVYSRDVLMDYMTLNLPNAVTVGHTGDLNNISAADRSSANRHYSKLVPGDDGEKVELERHKAFLKTLDIDTNALQPRIWLTAEDEDHAEKLLAKNGIQPDQTIAIFAGAQFDYRQSELFCEAIRDTCIKGKYSVIALGTQDEHAVNQANLDRIDAHKVNLCGQTNLRTTAAILHRCRLAVGSETGTAHLAAAVSTPNVVLMGGGHFGRFMPWSNLTSLACLPLDCYGCNWKCRYDRFHCLQDIQVDILRTAVEETLKTGSDKPRIFAAASAHWHPKESDPKWMDINDYMDFSHCDVIVR